MSGGLFEPPPLEELMALQPVESGQRGGPGGGARSTPSLPPPAPAPAAIPGGPARALFEPPPAEELRAPVSEGRDAINKTLTPVIRGASSLAGLPRDASDLAATVNDAGMGALGMRDTVAGRVSSAVQQMNPLRSMPSGSDIRNFLFGNTGVQETDAETPAGRIAQSTVEFGVGSAIPTSRLNWLASMMPNISLGALSGLFSGGAREATRGTPNEDMAALAGALTPAAGQLINHLARPGAGAVVNRALQGVTEDQLTRAHDLITESYRLGDPLTVDEALQQVMGARNPALQTVRRVAEQTPEGAPVMREITEGRPEANRALANTTIGEIDNGRFPWSRPPNPAEAPAIPSRVQRAAEQAIVREEQARTAAVTPLYQQAQAQLARSPYRSELMRTVTQTLNEIEQLAASDTTGLLRRHLDTHRIPEAFQRVINTRSGPQMFSLSDLEGIDRARKFFRDTVTTPPAPGSVALDRELASRAGDVFQGLRDRLVAISDTAAGGGPGSGPFGRALNEYQRITNEVIDPLRQGLVGRIGDGAANAGEQYRTLIPTSPGTSGLPTNPVATGEAVRRLTAQDPTAARDLVATHLRGAFEEAAQRFKTIGASENGGAGFSAAIAGNAEQRAVLQAAIQNLPGGREAWRGFERMLEVFDAQQYRPVAGSMTAFNQQAQRDISTGGLGQAVENVVNLPAAPGKIREWVDRARYGANSEQLARILTSHEGIARLRALARVESGSPAASAILVGMLSADRATGTTSSTNPNPRGGTENAPR